MLTILRTASKDLREGLRQRRLFLALAREDIDDQHRRTALGPLWLLINYLAFAGTFIFVFKRGDAGAADYPAYVATGLLVWFFIMEVLTQSVSLFWREESFIKGTTLPLTVYVMRLLIQSALRSGYALIGCLGILAASGVGVTPAWAWSLAGLLLILAVAPAAIFVFAFLGAYFPDTQFVIANLMRVGMFLTPVFWSYEGSGGVQHLFYYWNPFTYLIEVVRSPVIHGTFPAQAFLLCATIGIAFWALAVALLGSLRHRLVFAI